MLDQTSPGRPPEAPPPREGGLLREALRRARIEAAEQTDVVIDLRQAEIARLEMLRDELAPVFAEVPAEVDLFDVGLAPGDRPRLFVDMVSFVEMSRDRRMYRFMRDGRHGRVCAAESEKTAAIVEAITSYVARRLIERERLLADDDRVFDSSSSRTHMHEMAARSEPEQSASPPPPSAARAPAPPAAPPAGRPWLRAITILLAFMLGGALGAAVVGGVILASAKGLLPF
ncbi:hypothetical protein [Hansschlegelia zhihuaiae]|uniref:Uncharacterized protein n=1 Tax=Hansschlegelia zhihuaiae TaxID=405005 RepID=A0A4Q0MIM2_9HYPH|nr:hypothetical protein [Hansschlegelia zhihuaiae]RXF73511.1 hypothetical protein EK403_09970 [Hansschlegelia zhihuaiae]